MAYSMKARRDGSVQNVPVVGWQDGVDAQDTILWAALPVTEQLVTDGFGKVALADPVVDDTHRAVDDGGTARQRDYAAAIVVTRDSDAATLYAGDVDPTEGTLTVYEDEGKSAAASNTAVTVSYRKAVPVKTDASGRQVVATDPGAPLDVAVDDTVPVQVDVASELPAGSNTIGVVQVEGLEAGVGAYRAIYAADVRGDGKTRPDFGLFVANLPVLYNGDGKNSRQRNALYHEGTSVNVAAGATAAAQRVWTLTNAGWKVAMLGYAITATGPATVQFKIGATAFGPPIYVDKTGPVSVQFQNIWMAPLGGHLDVDVTNRDGAGAVDVQVTAWGTEE